DGGGGADEPFGEAIRIDGEAREEKVGESPGGPDDREVAKTERVEGCEEQGPDEARRAGAEALALDVGKEMSLREPLCVLEVDERVVEGDGGVARLREDARDRRVGKKGRREKGGDVMELGAPSLG